MNANLRPYILDLYVDVLHINERLVDDTGHNELIPMNVHTHNVGQLMILSKRNACQLFDDIRYIFTEWIILIKLQI